MVAGQSLFLIVVAAVVFFLVLVANVYILINYMHPDDKNQAWFPKLVVICGLSIAMLTVLAFPLDVANTRACEKDNVLANCDVTLPMRLIWYIIYIVSCVMIFVIIPFTVFYYEQDEDTGLCKRISSSLGWTAMFVLVFALVVGIIWGVSGKAEFQVMSLSSPVVEVGRLGGKSVSEYFGDTNAACLPADTKYGTALPAADDSKQCNFEGGKQTTESVDVSYPTYVIAAASVIGWVFLIVFGSFGLVALPFDLIKGFFGRPKQTITRSEYIKRARVIGEDAMKIRSIANDLKQQERSGGKSWKWRQQSKQLSKQVLKLEEDEQQLQNMFPQGEDRDSKWGMYIVTFYFSFLFGIIFALVAVAWLAHIIFYMLPSEPWFQMLNLLFKELDDVWSLLGVIAFTIFCSYLILSAIKGHIKMGVSPIFFINLYPMRVGATLMTSFLVNTALIMLTSLAVLQFSAQAFDIYAQSTAIGEIFGSQVNNMKYINVLFKNKVFIYIFLVCALLGTIYYFVSGTKKWRRKSKMSAYEV